MSALEALHPRLCSLLNATPLTLRSSSKLHLLSISIPLSDSPLDTILLTLASTYLSYALTIFTYVFFTPAQSTKDTTQSLKAFSNILTTTPSLISWIPIFSSLPVKQLDSALTRAYTTLTKACTACKSQPKAVFQLRTYATTCLAHTSAGTVEPDTFWDQVCRFAGAFIKSHDCTEEEAMSIVLSAYSDLITSLDKRSDRNTFMAGKEFVGFCEYWMAFAKKVGRLCFFL
jgi:separase